MKKELEFQGEKYPSLRALALKLNLNYRNVARRLQNGWSLEQALEHAPAPKLKAHNARILETMKGNFKSIRAASEAYGIQEQTLAKRLRDGWSVSEAVGDVQRQIRHPRRGNTVVCEGKSYDSVVAFADAFQMNRQRTRKRLNSGWTPEQAVELEPAPPRFRNQDGSAREQVGQERS